MTNIKNFASILMVFCLAIFSVQAQDHIYFNPDTDGGDAYYTSTSDDWDEDDYRSDYENYDEDYDDEDYAYDDQNQNFRYSSRIRRFRNPYRGFGYYDPCYVDAFYYDPFFNPGLSIYVTNGFNNPWGFNRWNRWNRFNAWNNPWNSPWNNPWAFNNGWGASPWGWNTGWGYNGFNSGLGWNNGFGYNGCPGGFNDPFVYTNNSTNTGQYYSNSRIRNSGRTGSGTINNRTTRTVRDVTNDTRIGTSDPGVNSNPNNDRRRMQGNDRSVNGDSDAIIRKDADQNRDRKRSAIDRDRSSREVTPRPKRDTRKRRSIFNKRDRDNKRRSIDRSNSNRRTRTYDRPKRSNNDRTFNRSTRKSNSTFNRSNKSSTPKRSTRSGGGSSKRSPRGPR